MDTNPYNAARAARGFPAPPRASRAPVGAVLSESIFAADSSIGDRFNGSTGSNVFRQANGAMSWALALVDQRVRVPAESHIWAYPGQTLRFILAQLPTMLKTLPERPSFMYVHAGTNSLAAGASFADMVQDYDTIAKMNAQNDIQTIFSAILPRATGVLTAAQWGLMDRVNRWLAAYAQKSGGWVLTVNSFLDDLTDPLLTGGAQPRTGMFYDNTHPRVLGGYLMGVGIADALRQLFPYLDILPTNSIIYDAANSPNGNFLNNGMMTGAAGAVTTPGSGTISGTAPTSWTAAMSSTAGLTVANSQVISALSGNPMHQMVFGGTYTVTGAPSIPTYGIFGRVFQSVPTGFLPGILPGDTLEAACEFEIDAGFAELAFPSLEFRWGGAAAYNGDLMPKLTFIDTGGNLPTNKAIRGVMRSPIHTFDRTPTAGEAVLNLYARLTSINGTYNPVGTIRFGRAVIQKVGL